ncbi:MAG: hypothetical protein P1U40_01545 [Coxiellaceae bacterium]|nr:hypothetical protein [Coxiellaceae bacterium]
MLTLNQWLKRQRGVQGRLVTIQQAIFGNKLNAYMYFRLRFFTFSTLIVTSVHLIEFYLLTVIFSFSHIISILILRSISMVINGSWWGTLELLRSEVRSNHRAGQRQYINGIISSWLTLATLLAVITLAIFLTVICIRMQHPATNSSEHLFLLYVAIVGISIAAQFITQTLHAGAYGLRRVYRPFWSISIANIIGLIVLAIGWPWIREYSLPLSMLISSLVALGLTAIYTLKTYHVLGIEDFYRIQIKPLVELFKQFANSEIWMASVSSLFMKTEGVLILVMLLGNTNHHQFYEPFIIFYLIAPLISASFEWPRLFYFDLKRFNRSSFQQVLSTLNTHVLKTSLLIGIALWLITVLVTVAYFQHFYAICFLLLPFFLVRSYTGYQQMLRFTANHYNDVLFCSGAVLVMAVIARYLEFSIDGAIASLTLVTLLGIFYLFKPHSPSIQTMDEDPLPNLYQWIIDWKKHRNEPKAEIIELGSNYTAHVSQLVLRKVNNELLGKGKACLASKGIILFYQDTKNALITKDWLSYQLAGIAYKHCRLEEPLASYLYRLANEPVHHNTSYLIDHFKQEFKNGIVISFHKEDKASNPHLTKQQSTQIYFSMLQTLGSPLQPQPRNYYHTLVIYEQGVQTLLAIPQSDAPGSQIKRWARQVFIANLNRLI